MSPSESDLRAALRDGEGDDAPDVDEVIARARAHRSQRRARVLSVAAAVVVVAAAGVGGAVLWGGSDGGSDTGAAQGAGTPVATRPASPGSSATADPGPGRTVTACPAGFPTRALPADGLSSGAGGPMFASPVGTVLICSYTGTGSESTAARSVTLTGSNASALVDSIEAASTARLHVVCPDIVTAQKAQLAIVARTADGKALPTVTTDVSVPNCNQPITNGTAVRYAWKPPAAVAARIAGLIRVQPTGGGGLNGSPVR